MTAALNALPIMKTIQVNVCRSSIHLANLFVPCRDTWSAPSVAFRTTTKANRKLFSVLSCRQHDAKEFKKYTFPQPKPKTYPKMTRTAYIALGSNMGDRIGWIEKACSEMDMRGIRIKRTSSLWETEPMYVLDQDRFVNGACEVSSFQIIRCFQG
jgi:hypothetical protein